MLDFEQLSFSSKGNSSDVVIKALLINIPTTVF